MLLLLLRQAGGVEMQPQGVSPEEACLREASWKSLPFLGVWACLLIHLAGCCEGDCSHLQWWHHPNGKVWPDSTTPCIYHARPSESCFCTALLVSLSDSLPRLWWVTKSVIAFSPKAAENAAMRWFLSPFPEGPLDSHSSWGGWLHQICPCIPDTVRPFNKLSACLFVATQGSVPALHPFRLCPLDTWYLTWSPSMVPSSLLSGFAEFFGTCTFQS